MEEVTDPQVVSARRALLDALEALGTQRDAVILVGAQAIYLHTGGAGVALAEFTTDADLAVDPTKLRADPLVQDSMMAGGFTPDPDVSALGTWRSRDGIPVDLLVPDAVAGRGRRSAKVPPHDERAMRRAVGLEAGSSTFNTQKLRRSSPPIRAGSPSRLPGPPRSLSPSSTRSRSGSTHQLDRTRRTPTTSTACSSQSTQPHLSRHFVRSCATQSRG